MPWSRLPVSNEVLGPGHSMSLPSGLHNPLLYQLYPPSPLDKIIHMCVLEQFVRSFMGCRAISESVQAQRCPVSCLGDTTSTGRTSPVSVSSTNRVGSCRMVFITRFPLIVWFRWLLSEQVKILHFSSRPRHVGFFQLPLERVLTPDTTRR